MSMCYYQFQAGVETRSYYHELDDKWARRLWATWLAWAWPLCRKRVRENHPGSIAEAINEGWYDDPPDVLIVRRDVDETGVVPCVDADIVENFKGTPEAVVDFIKKWKLPG